MLISVTQVRAGMILQIDGALFRVMKTHHVAPGNVRGAMQTTMRNLATGTCCPTPGRPSTFSMATSSASPCRPRWI